MATINDIGIPGVGTGILQPRLKNRWRVTFANLGGGADSQPLSLQAVTLTRPVLSFEELTLYNPRLLFIIDSHQSWSLVGISDLINLSLIKKVS